MSYKHFGKQADVWKHLVLCEVLANEQPLNYIETNSACSSYSLQRTVDQQYGIYNFIDKAPNYPDLSKSKYFELESVAMNEGRYLGSPGLAMAILGLTSQKLVFFDIEVAPLTDIVKFAKRHQLHKNVEVISQDSVIGVLHLLPNLPKSTIIHIDPYFIDKPSANGCNYMDLFIHATVLGLKCVLWYGFNTLKEKKQINDFITANLKDCKVDNVSCIELIMSIIQKDTISCNPGILGSGLLTSNLSTESTDIMNNYSEQLIDLYKEAKYNTYDGSLYREIIKVKDTVLVPKKPCR